jgi:hypothetical protein
MPDLFLQCIVLLFRLSDENAINPLDVNQYRNQYPQSCLVSQNLEADWHNEDCLVALHLAKGGDFLSLIVGYRWQESEKLNSPFLLPPSGN